MTTLKDVRKRYRDILAQHDPALLSGGSGDNLTVKEFRLRLRPVLVAHAKDLMEWCGFREKRKDRALPDPNLQWPTLAQKSLALNQMASGMGAHEVEAYWAHRGVRISRNWLSQQSGARP